MAIQNVNAKQLDALGFRYQQNPPNFLSPAKSTEIGEAEYIKFPSDEGEVWDAGYNRGHCLLVTAAAAVVPPIEKTYVDYFG